jgi:hypothetical protein
MRHFVAAAALCLLPLVPLGSQGDRREQGHWVPPDGEVCEDAPTVPPHQACTTDPQCFCFWDYSQNDRCWVLIEFFCA